MAPPQFSNIGKKAKDLFKKEYCFKNQLKITSKAGGVKLESGAKSCKNFGGYSKANFKADIGDVELETTSCGSTKGKLKMSKVMDDTNVTISAAQCSKGVKGDIEATYETSSVAATSKVAHCGAKGAQTVSASAVVGVEGVAVGGNLEVSSSGALLDYNCGVEYVYNGDIFSLYTASKGSKVTGSIYKKVTSDTVVAGTATIKASGENLFAYGYQYNLDKSTLWKAKVDSSGVFASAVSHKLKDCLGITFSSEYNVLDEDCFTAKKFGVSLTLG